MDDPFQYQTDMLAVLRLFAVAWDKGPIVHTDWTRHVFTSTDLQDAFWLVCGAFDTKYFIGEQGRTELERFDFSLLGDERRQYVRGLLTREDKEGNALWGMVKLTNKHAVKRLHAKLKDCILGRLQAEHGIVEENLPREIADRIRFINMKPPFKELWRKPSKGINLQYRGKQNGAFNTNAPTLHGEVLEFTDSDMTGFLSVINEDTDMLLVEFRRQYVKEVFDEFLNRSRKLFKLRGVVDRYNYTVTVEGLLCGHFNVSIGLPWMLNKDYSDAIQEERKKLRRLGLVGLPFGWLTVDEVLASAKGQKDRHKHYRCKCACGREVIASSDALKLGRAVSCGKCGKPKTFDFAAMAQGTRKAYDNAKQAPARRGVPCLLDDPRLFFRRMGMRPHKHMQLHRDGHETGQKVPYSLDACVWLDQSENAARTKRQVRLRHPDGGTAFTREEAAEFFQVSERTIDRFRKEYGDDGALAALRERGHPRKPRPNSTANTVITNILSDLGNCAQKTPEVDRFIGYANRPDAVIH